MSQTTTRAATGGMAVRIVVTPTGKIGFFTESGTFEQGNAKVNELLAALGAGGLTFTEIGEPEQHRHDGEPETVLSAAHQMSHAH